jgi:hypothetical protein
MTSQEAQANVGNQFKWLGSDGGVTSHFDIIKKVKNDWIYGEFIAAPAEDCRLKQDQPDHLKKNSDE